MVEVDERTIYVRTCDTGRQREGIWVDLGVIKSISGIWRYTVVAGGI